jgi:drug/metabolite transporter (DMT)-like permease
MPLRHDMRRGVICMLAACALFAGMSAGVKSLSGNIPFPELMFFRCALAMPVVGAIAFRSGRWDLLRTKRFPGHFYRACTGLLAMSCSFYALGLLPLAEHTALTNATPLFVTMLSIPFLGEKVGVHRWSAVVVGFWGIMVIALSQGAFQGGAAELATAGVVAAVAQSLFSGVTTMLVRGLSETESSTTIVMWQSLLMTLMTGLALPFVWVTPSLEELALLVLIGLLGGIAQVLLTEAWASAQVSAIAPLSYSSIAWAALLGWIVFGDLPSGWTLLGAGLIVAASLYIMHRELKLRRERERRKAT